MNSLPTIKLYKAVILVADKICGRKDSNIPYISLEHLDSNCSNLKRHGLAIDSISTNNVFKEDDILLGKLRPQLRKCIQSKIQGYCSTDILVFRPTNGASAQYLGHIFCSDIVFSEAIKREEGTGMPRTSWAAIKDLDIFYPSYSEQYKIAEILTTVDNLIEQTEAAIAKYQAIKQGMMHDLFTRGVDANGHLRPPREEAPELYKESELGWIPKEWAVKPVHGIGSVRLGRQRSPKHTSGKYTTPYLRVANVFDGWIDYSDILKMDFTPEEKSTYNVLPKDIFLNEGQSLELVGRSAIYNGKPDRYCFQNTLIRFRSFPENDHKFCWLVFKNWLDTELFMTIARQTTSVAHLGADRFSKLPFARPSHDEQVRISLRLDTVESKTQKIKQTRDKLQVLKSGLMQDLLSGRVRVPTDATTLQEPPHAS